MQIWIMPLFTGNYASHCPSIKFTRLCCPKEITNKHWSLALAEQFWRIKKSRTNMQTRFDTYREKVHSCSLYVITIMCVYIVFIFWRESDIRNCRFCIGSARELLRWNRDCVHWCTKKSKGSYFKRIHKTSSSIRDMYFSACYGCLWTWTIHNTTHCECYLCILLFPRSLPRDDRNVLIRLEICIPSSLVWLLNWWFTEWEKKLVYE